MIAYLYAGQGAQYEGMGRDLAAQSPAARELFERASEVAGRDLLALNEADLATTALNQLATFTHSLAARAALDEALGDVDPASLAHAGFSLGEYAALVASGVVELEPCIELLRQRAAFMEEACQAERGAMVAVLGLEDWEVLDLLSDEPWCDTVFPANFNAPGQLVIAGYEEQVLEAAEHLRRRGARRCVRLNVAGAFHSPLMASAARQLREAARNLVPHPGTGLLMSSVYGEPFDGSDALPDYLARQITNPVRWATVVENLSRRGAQRWVEFGPGTVLSGLVKRQFRDDMILHVDDAASLEATREALSAD